MPTENFGKSSAEHITAESISPSPNWVFFILVSALIHSFHLEFNWYLFCMIVEKATVHTHTTLNLYDDLSKKLSADELYACHSLWFWSLCAVAITNMFVSHEHVVIWGQFLDVKAVLMQREIFTFLGKERKWKRKWKQHQKMTEALLQIKELYQVLHVLALTSSYLFPCFLFK